MRGQNVLVCSTIASNLLQYGQSSEQVTISCGTRVSKIPKYLDTYKERYPDDKFRFDSNFGH